LLGILDLYSFSGMKALEVGGKILGAVASTSVIITAANTGFGSKLVKSEPSSSSGSSASSDSKNSSGSNNSSNNSSDTKK
jgi:hypothetical protein